MSIYNFYELFQSSMLSFKLKFEIKLAKTKSMFILLPIIRRCCLCFHQQTNMKMMRRSIMTPSTMPRIMYSISLLGWRVGRVSLSSRSLALKSSSSRSGSSGDGVTLGGIITCGGLEMVPGTQLSMV